MGGGGGADHAHGEDFRKNVWSATGGPYCRPKHWKRNTAIAMFGIFLVCIPIAMKSAELEPSMGIDVYTGTKSNHQFSKWSITLDNKVMSCKNIKIWRQVFTLLLIWIIYIFTSSLCLQEQRPHHPIRPIPSQLWCKNFGKKEY